MYLVTQTCIHMELKQYTMVQIEWHGLFSQIKHKLIKLDNNATLMHCKCKDKNIHVHIIRAINNAMMEWIESLR